MSRLSEHIKPIELTPSLNGHDKKLTPDDVLEKYQYLRITDLTEIPPPNARVKINGEMIWTEGNIGTISGASKSAKTAFANIIIAGALSVGTYDGIPGVEITPCNGSAVVHIDTEQARHKHQSNLRSILKRCCLTHCPKNFLSYNIRKEEIANYQSITNQILEAAHSKFNGIHLVVIDGAADYLPDVNDPIESNKVVKFLEEAAIQFSTTVLIIIHVNPGGDKERGHLGSQLQRKSESVLSMKTQDGISYIEPKFLRMAGNNDIPLIQLRYDKEKGYHVYDGLRVSDPAEKEFKKLEIITELAAKVFAMYPLNYDDAVESIMKNANRGVTTAKGYFKQMKAHGIIIQNSNENWTLNEEKQ